MSSRGRWVFLIVSHGLVAVWGFGLAGGYIGREAAKSVRGTPQKRLGGELASLGVEPTLEGVTRGLKELEAAKAELGEPLAAVLELRLLTVAAKLSASDTAIERAMAACRERKWPSCDRASILAMGASR